MAELAAREDREGDLVEAAATLGVLLLASVLLLALGLGSEAAGSAALDLLTPGALALWAALAALAARPSI